MTRHPLTVDADRKDAFPGNILQAIFWTIFGPDSHSLVRYFDHGKVPTWAKETEWTRKTR